MRLSQTQANISAFNWCLILRAFIVIILLDRKKKSKVVQFNRVHDLIYWFDRLCCETIIDLIFCRFHIKKNYFEIFLKSNHVFHMLFSLFFDLC